VTESYDAVVVGPGPNGLVGANLLADAGWSVAVLEASEDPGGAVRSAADHPAPGYIADLFSAFYPLAAASPVLQGMRLEEHRLRWVHAPAVLAHVFDDGRSALLSRDVDETAASLDSFAAGDGEAWRRWVRPPAPRPAQGRGGRRFRRADRGGGRAAGTRVPRRRRRPQRPEPGGPRGRRPRAGRRCSQRRHRRAPPAAAVPAHTGARPAGHPVPRTVPRRLLRASRRWRARRLRCQRRAGRAAACPGRPTGLRRDDRPRPTPPGRPGE
jgi:hypothetical protein